MSKRAQVQARLQLLAELGDILNAMKNLSVIEITRLSRLLEGQDEVDRKLAEARMAFLAAHGAARLGPPRARVWLLIGSERGLCGAFNQAVEEAWRERMKAGGMGRERGRKPVACATEGAEMEGQTGAAEGGEARRKPVACATEGGKMEGAWRAIVVGARLGARLEVEAAGGPVTVLEGPLTRDDVLPILHRVTRLLARLARSGELHPAAFEVICRREGEGGVETAVLRPLEDYVRRAAHGFWAPPRCWSAPPLLHEAPERVRRRLTEHTLFAVLQAALYRSLLAEHRQRARHLENALRHLDELRSTLVRRQHILRQEEITQEIELLLLAGE